VIADDGEYCEEQEIEDWEFSQEITSEEPIAEDSSYGFANMRSDILQRLREETRELGTMHNKEISVDQLFKGNSR
jgi:hypothetical protein